MGTKVSKFISIIVLFVFIWSCQSEQPPIAPEASPDQQTAQKVATTVLLYLSPYATNANKTVGVHVLTEDWDEAQVTWFNAKIGVPWSIPGGVFTDLTSVPTFSPLAPWVTVNITEIFMAWHTNTLPNFGLILIQQAPDLTRTTYYSSTGANPPYVEVYWADGTVETILITQDAYIWENATGPHNNEALYTGNVNGLEKRSLLRFDIPPDDRGCTLTPGYWKTHSKYGPAPYDPTWNGLEDNIFFYSDLSWYEVLWTEPKGGNAYFILAHAYIAAKLNQFNGADISEISLTIVLANDLLLNYTPDHVAGLKGKAGKEEREIWIDIAAILDDYNNGITGPGHCD